jgi:hypothetical protein
MPVADEARLENRMAPIFRLGWRGGGAHQPAGFRRAGLGLGIETQKKSGDGFLRAGERQPPACHQIENFWFARNLDDDGAQGGAGERVMCGAKRIRCIGHTKQQQVGGINSELKKTGCRKLAEFEGGKILADPEQAFSRGHAGGEARGETGCRRFMAGPCENLMQYAALKSTLQAEIGGGMAERNADCGFLQSRPGEGGPEGRYGVAVHGMRKEQNRNTVKQVVRESHRNLVL